MEREIYNQIWDIDLLKDLQTSPLSQIDYQIMKSALLKGTKIPISSKPISSTITPFPVAEEPNTISATYRIAWDELSLLSCETREQMYRNAVCSDYFSDEDTQWCRENCTDLWSINDSEDLIRFSSKEDMTLFLIARTR